MTFTQRLIGALALKAEAYEEVEADRSSTVQAMGVVLLSAAAAGVGARGLGVPSIATVAVVALIAWVAWAMLIYQIGTRLLPGRNTHADLTELLRTIGFAAAPGILRILGVVPALAAPVFALTAIWMLLAMVVAVRQALDYTSTMRALAVCGLGWVLTIVFVVTLGLLMTPAVSAPRASGGMRESARQPDHQAATLSLLDHDSVHARGTRASSLHAAASVPPARLS